MKLVAWFAAATGMTMSIVGFAAGTMTNELASIIGGITGLAIAGIIITWDE